MRNLSQSFVLVLFVCCFLSAAETSQCAHESCHNSDAGDEGGFMQVKSLSKASLAASEGSKAALDKETDAGVSIKGIKASLDTKSDIDGSPGETISTFCNGTGLASMHGVMAEDGALSQEKLEDQVMASVTTEMESNNVDKVARDMFTMYICIRWVPDRTFWKLARQELAAELLESVVDDQEAVEQAVAELYRTYKFVPMLCSSNLNVFDQTDAEDNTYFRHFAKKVSKLAGWLKEHGNDTVAQRLESVDHIFCGGKNMNDNHCNSNQNFNDFMTSATSALGKWGWNAETKKDKWHAMADLFHKFSADAPGASAEWGKSLAEWKKSFPFHSFVSKQDGMPSKSSPTSSQRFLVCFGKRVASELHRRPAGRYIMTDQNNLGCHGFWDAKEVVNMLQRTVELWKPPTCQMAEMTYVLKKKMLMMYAKMSEKLFDALPSLVNDEQLREEGALESALQGPSVFDPTSVTHGGRYYVDGMRVKAVADVLDPPDCNDSFFASKKCRYVASEGTYGTVANSNGHLAVVWDGDDERKRVTVSAADALEVVPRGWRARDSTLSKAWDLVSGMGSSISSAAQGLVDSLYTPRQTNLGQLLAGSASKWVVCPIRNDADLQDLDGQLGVEDPAMQDMQKEAYSAWTGYKATLPGEKCTHPTFSATKFPGSEMCEISELHADHLEKYTLPDGSLEQFLCPVKVSLPGPEQLDVLLNKPGKCYLHMTNKQLRQYQWKYNGDFPARKQNDRKPNLPNVEYELIKLLRVPGSGEVSYARTCSPAEQRASPRFCKPMQLHNKWPTVAEMADSIGTAAIGSVGMGASAITSAISGYGSILSANASAGAKAKNAAHRLGEEVWDSLTGAGRLLSSTAESAVKSVSYGLPGAAQRDERIEDEIFATSEAGLLLHAMSFQESIGKSGHTSNSKERYTRYVVTMPCPDFDPALEFSVKKTWSAVVLKMVASAIRNGATSLLGKTSAELTLRGDSRYFLRDNKKTSDSEWETSGASLALSGISSGEPAVKCEKKWSWGSLSCVPASDCERSWGSCVPKAKISESGWWRADDPTLINAVTKGSLGGVTVTFHCGRKREFDDTESGPNSRVPLKECLEKGVAENAKIRAKEPWKLYFPEETVVVAVFGTLSSGEKCKTESGATSTSKICSGAETDSKLDAHLIASDKKSSDGRYQGIRSGAGFPRGTPYELVLRPEDVLEAAGLMKRLL